MEISSEIGSFGSLLKAFRTARHLTQQQLADRLSVRRNTVGSWERGDFLPGSKALVLELARYLRLDEQESRLLLEASLTALAPYWLVPSPRNPFFTGRQGVLEALHAQLGGEHALALTQSSALYGLGGIGKTQIALEYAYRYGLEYSAVCWIGAESSESITSSLLSMAEVLGVPERESEDQQRVVAAVQRWLATHGRWLLIWDNVEDLELLQRFLPSTRSGAMLITTRLQALGTFARGLDLLPMEQEEGVLFLLRRAKVLPQEASGKQVRRLAVHSPAQYAAAVELVETMGGLPLALDQAGAYLEETRCGVPAYLDLFRARRTALLRQRGESAQGHPASVSTTFRLALAATAHRHPAVENLLRVCACLYPEAIPEELFHQGSEHLGSQLEAVCRDALEWDRLVGVACSYSLLSRQPEERTLSLHRLVQAAVLDGMSETERKQWSARAIKALDVVFPEVRPTTGYVLLMQCKRVLPHALHCLIPTESSEESLTVASLAYKAALALQARGQYAEAEPLYLQAWQIREQVLGPVHPEVASSLHYLAGLYREQGKYAEAEPLSLRALQIREQTLGPEHPEVAASLDHLAGLYREQGKYTEAEPLHLRALQIQERALGPDHLEVATSLNNLALLYWEQGRYTEAESFYLRVLQIHERTLGRDHPTLARSLNNLAILYWVQGRYTEAEPLHLRAVQIRGQTLGPAHPHLADSLDNLGILYRDQGRFAEAEPLYQRAWQIREQALGPKHPLVASSLNNLAIIYQDQGRYTEAEPLYLRALQIQEQAQGPAHPDVAFPLTNLANLYLEQNLYQEVEPLYLRALRIWEQTLGLDHLYLAEPLTGLANLYREQDREGEAEPLYLRALSIRERQLDSQHPDTAETLYGLALLRQKQGRLNEALSLTQRALSIRSQALGDAHPKTEAARTLYDQLLREQGQAGAQEETEWSPEASDGGEAALPLQAEADPLASENASLQAFLSACCELHPRAWCRSADLWQAYERWIEGRQERFPLSRREFIAQVKARGCRADRTKTARIWRGIALVKTSDDSG